MQPARFKLHAEERTCNPVQRPSFRDLAREEPRQTISPKIPKVQLGKTAEGEPRATGRRRKTGSINPCALSSLALLPALLAAPLNVVAVCPPEGCGCSGHPSYRCLPLFGMDAARACTNMSAQA